VHGSEFKEANGILDGLIKLRSRLGLESPTKHKAVIEMEDLEKIYVYLKGAKKSQIILRHAVWYFLTIHFVSRGMEFHYQLEINSFKFHEDESGKYVTLEHDTLQKNHQGQIIRNDGCNLEKRMYATYDPHCCPVELLRLMINKTESTASHLFNHYYRDAILDSNTFKWFSSKRLSKRSFARFLKEICIAAGVTKEYTPHCLRATAIAYLKDCRFQARHIMFMNDYKSESFL
jgi:hypothetical protein